MPHAPRRLSLSERLAFAAKALGGVFSDRRTIQAAHGLLAGVLTGGAQGPRKGTRDLLQLYVDSPLMRTVVGSIARRFSAVQWQVMAPVGGGLLAGKRLRQAAILRGMQQPHRRHKLASAMVEAGDLEVYPDHPLAGWLDNPNPVMTGVQFRQLYSIYWDTVGEFFGAWGRNALGVPVEIYPVPPHWCQSLPSGGDAYYRFSFGGWNVTIPEMEVIYFRDFDPVNPYARGAGAALAAVDELYADEKAGQRVAEFYETGRPALLIHGELGSPQAVKEAEDSYLTKLRNFWRAPVPHFMDTGSGSVTVTPLSQDFDKAQMVESRTKIRDAIVSLYGIAPETVGIIENSNRATIAAADYLVASSVIVPRCEILRANLQQTVVPLYDRSLVVDYESPVREDETAQLEHMRAAPWAFTADEWRERAGFERIDDDGGEVYAVPFSTEFRRSLEPVDDLEAPAVPAEALPFPPADDGEDDEERAAIRRWRAV